MYVAGGQVRDRLTRVTTVGHSLTGLSIAVLTLPRGRSLGWYLLIGHFFVFFANVPDFPLPGWGHDSYQVSHSIFLTTLLAALMALLLLLPKFNARVGMGVVVAWTAAWFSHMLLDSMYSHGQGIGIFWPFSDTHLALPVPWFDTLRWPPITEHNRRVFAIELAVYGSLLAACVWIRSRSKTASSSPP
jgi:membrane-bound metal-dependent hydrolase YbcI (DUF457 family)